MLQSGWIQHPSASPFGTPVLIVPKSDGSLRMCIDYRALNKLIIEKQYPLPRIDDLMDNLAGAKYFSALDLTLGYDQLTMHPDDRATTAFNTHIGKYEYRILPMGLCLCTARVAGRNELKITDIAQQKRLHLFGRPACLL